jgi:dTDP-L-rhamnose 4-epimerase
MKILITGGAGFIGSKLIDRLLLDNHEIIVLDNFLNQIHGNKPTLKNGVKYIFGDVRKKSDWLKSLKENPEIIFHLASETGTGQSMDKINRYVNTNVVGTSIMLDLVNSNKYGVKKIILTSSRAVYGDEENIESNYVLKPKSVYGVTKLTQEQLIITGCNIPYTILRYQNVYGEGQSLNNPYTGIITIFSNIFEKGGEVSIFDNGLATRDFIHVNDVVDATYLAINEKTNYNIYNVGTGIDVPILEVTKKLKNLINKNSTIKIIDYHRKGDIINAKADIKKIITDLNWSPIVTLDEGLERFVEWFKLIKK